MCFGYLINVYWVFRSFVDGANVHFTSTYGSQRLAIQASFRLVVIQVDDFMNQACVYSGQGVKLPAANPVDP